MAGLQTWAQTELRFFFPGGLQVEEFIMVRKRRTRSLTPVRRQSEIPVEGQKKREKQHLNSSLNAHALLWLWRF